MIGLKGTMAIDFCLMFIHSFFCCSILGAFFVYLLLDLYFTDNANQARLTDTTVLLVFSLPFLFIFLIGCHSLYLTSMVYDELKERKKEKKERYE